MIHIPILNSPFPFRRHRVGELDLITGFQYQALPSKKPSTNSLSISVGVCQPPIGNVARCEEVRSRNIEPNWPTRNNPIGWSFRKIGYAVGQIGGNDKVVMCRLLENDVPPAIVTVDINCQEIPSTKNLYA